MNNVKLPHRKKFAGNLGREYAVMDALEAIFTVDCSFYLFLTTKLKLITLPEKLAYIGDRSRQF